MMQLLTLFLLLTLAFCIQATSLQEALVLEGKDWTFGLQNDAAKSAEGIKRQLYSEEKWQFFYFCGIAKNKSKCGSWVDEKGAKIKGLVSNVKRTDEGALISKMSVKEGGRYTRVPENPDETQAYLESVTVHVQAPPPPPPKY